jgi:RNA polymerase-binding transcription factor DksA
MQNVHQQCQTQLELERVLIVNKVQQFTRTEANVTDDPVNWQVLQQMQNQLGLIEKAQKRLANGQFGLCQICRQPIEPERLEILPYAEHCVSCKRVIEHATLRGSHNKSKYYHIMEG